MNCLILPPRILAQLTLVKSFDTFMEKTWQSSPERVAIICVWAVNSREIAWSNSALEFFFGNIRNHDFLFMRTFFFGSPQFVINGIKVCLGVFCLRSDFRVLALHRFCFSK